MNLKHGFVLTGVIALLFFSCGSAQAGFLGSNYLVAGEPNTLSDVSAANATPGSLNVGDVVFGYQQLGQVVNTTNGTVNLPTGSAWTVFSFQVSSINSPGDGSTYVNLTPTPAANADSLQSLVPNLVAQTGLKDTSSLIALQINSVPNGTDLSNTIYANGTMAGAMSSFNTGSFATEFALGQVAANNDFLSVYAGTNALINGAPVTEAGGATVLYNTDGYSTFVPLANLNPDNGKFTKTKSEVTIAGTVYQQPGVGGAPGATTGAQATDHATYTLQPVPEPSSLILFTIATPLLIGVMRRRRRGQTV